MLVIEPKTSRRTSRAGIPVESLAAMFAMFALGVVLAVKANARDRIATPGMAVTLAGDARTQQLARLGGQTVVARCAFLTGWSRVGWRTLAEFNGGSLWPCHSILVLGMIGLLWGTSPGKPWQAHPNRPFPAGIAPTQRGLAPHSRTPSLEFAAIAAVSASAAHGWQARRCLRLANTRGTA